MVRYFQKIHQSNNYLVFSSNSKDLRVDTMLSIPNTRSSLPETLLLRLEIGWIK